MQQRMFGFGPRFRVDASANDEVIFANVYDSWMAAMGTPDFRWYPGDHAAGQYHDHREVGLWAARMFEQYG